MIHWLLFHPVTCLIILLLVPFIICAIIEYPRDKWVPRKCGFPYKDGWATYNPARKTILDTGLSKEQAIQICKELNEVRRKK